MNRKNEIEAVEEELRTAMLKSNINSLENLLADNLIFTNHLGQVITKADDIKSHEKGDFTFSALELSEQKILFAGDTAIVSVLAKVSGTYKGTPANGNFRFTRVWSVENGHWQVVAGHSSIAA